MSVLDRVKKAERTATISGDQESKERSSAISTASESPVISRLQLVITELAAYIKSNSNTKYSRYTWIIESIIREVFEEMTEAQASDESLAGWMEQFGRTLTWCGNGDDSILPPSVRDYIARNKPGMLAITAGIEVDQS